MTAEEAERLCGPEVCAELERLAYEAGPLTDEQARIIARLFGPKPATAAARNNAA